MVLAKGISQVPNIMSVSLTYDTSKLQEYLNTLSENVDKKVDLIFQLNESWATAWMKLNAPWTDNTGAARTGLAAISASQGSIHEMTLAYSVNYGIWLEVANSGRFQILGPALRYVSEKILSDMKYIFGGEQPTIGNNPGHDIPPVARKTARKGTANKSGSRRSRKAYGSRNGNRQP